MKEILIFFILYSLIATLSLGPINNVGRITEGEYGFDAVLENGSEFGRGVALFDDLDVDGVRELVVATDDGVLYLLWMNANHSVKSWVVIDVGESDFGSSVCAISDLDGDGISELLVGGETYTQNRGSIFIVWINAAGGVVNHIRIAYNGFGVSMSANTYFGITVAKISDLDNDGINEIAVGAIKYNSNKGCVFIMFLNSSGSITHYEEISGNDITELSANGSFGASVALIDDLDNDGIREIAVGQNSMNPVVYIIFLNSLGTVRDYTSIAPVGTSAKFGSSISLISDLDGDGIGEIAIGAPNDTESGSAAGALWIFKIDASGNSVSSHKISSNLGATITFPVGSNFGVSVSPLSNTSYSSIVVGTSGTGALWILEFTPIVETNIETTSQNEISTNPVGTTTTIPSFTTTLQETTDQYEITTTLQEEITTTPSQDDTKTTFQEEISTSEEITTTPSQDDTTTTFQEEISTSEEIVTTDTICQTYIPCVQSIRFCICSDKCPALGGCIGSTSNDVFLEGEEVSFPMEFTINSLSLKKSVLNVDSRTRIHIDQDLVIDDSTLTVNISAKEKETIVEGHTILIMSVEGNIEGTFKEITVLVEGKVDSSLEIGVEDNNFFLRAKEKDTTVTIILITTISFIVVLLTVILIILFTSKNFQKRFMHSDIETMTTEHAYQKSSQHSQSAEFEMES